MRHAFSISILFCLAGGSVQAAGPSASGTSTVAKPIFLNFFEEANLGSVVVKQPPAADRAIVRAVYQEKFYLGYDACPEGGGRANNVALAQVQTVKSPAAEGQLLHLVTITPDGCSEIPVAGAYSAFLVISGNGRVLTKTRTAEKNGLINVFNFKVFDLDPQPPAGVVVVSVRHDSRAHVTMDGWIYQIGSASIVELRALGTIYDSGCSTFDGSGERAAIFRLEGANPFQLSQENYERTCAAANNKEQSFNFVGYGKMNEPHATPLADDWYTRPLTSADLEGRTADELRILRNEIYARHGYVFKSKDLAARFKGESWYREVPAFDPASLTGVEKSNVALLKKTETDRRGQVGNVGD